MKTFIILGMHRSATSLVAEGLLDNGVYMGEDLSEHYENQDVKKVNQAILKAAGGRWDDPPPEYEIQRIAYSGRFKESIKLILSSYPDFKLIGWKDPRTTLTIRLWLPYLENPHFICCYREPLEVAKSLEKRNGFTIEKGLKLARIYNNRMMNFMNDWLEYENIS